MNQRITHFFQAEQVIGEEQAGFRSGYSTTDHVFVLKSIINVYVKKSNDYTVLLSTIKKHLIYLIEQVYG